MRDVLDFGKDGYIPLDEDTEPNFLGETMTASEFVEEETQDEVMRMNGMWYWKEYDDKGVWYNGIWSR